MECYKWPRICGTLAHCLPNMPGPERRNPLPSRYSPLNSFSPRALIRRVCAALRQVPMVKSSVLHSTSDEELASGTELEGLGDFTFDGGITDSIPGYVMHAIFFIIPLTISHRGIRAPDFGSSDIPPNLPVAGSLEEIPPHDVSPTPSTTTPPSTPRRNSGSCMFQLKPKGTKAQLLSCHAQAAAGGPDLSLDNPSEPTNPDVPFYIRYPSPDIQDNQAENNSNDDLIEPTSM